MFLVHNWRRIDFPEERTPYPPQHQKHPPLPSPAGSICLVVLVSISFVLFCFGFFLASHTISNLTCGMAEEQINPRVQNIS